MKKQKAAAGFDRNVALLIEMFPGLGPELVRLALESSQDNMEVAAAMLVSQSDVDSPLVEELRQHANDLATEAGPASEAVVSTLLRCFRNILRDPSNETFRRIRVTNPKFAAAVGRFQKSRPFLEAVGFVYQQLDGEELLIHPGEAGQLQVGVDTLENCMSVVGSGSMKGGGSTASNAVVVLSDEEDGVEVDACPHRRRVEHPSAAAEPIVISDSEEEAAGAAGPPHEASYTGSDLD